MSKNTDNWTTEEQRRERRERMRNAKQSGPRSNRKKNSGKTILTVLIVLALVIGAVAVLLIDGGILERTKTAAIVNGDHEVKSLELNYLLGSNFNAMYQSAAFTPEGKSLMNIEMMGQDGFITLRDSLLDQVKSQVSEIYALSDLAEEAGTSLEDSGLSFEQFRYQIQMAAMQQQMTPDDLLSRLFGRGASFKALEPIVTRQFLAGLYQRDELASFEFTDADYEAEYKANPDNYDVVRFHVFGIHPESPTLEEVDDLEAEEVETDQDATDADQEETATEEDTQDEEKAETDEVPVDETPEERQMRLVEKAHDKAMEMAAEVKSEKDFQDWALKLATPEQASVFEENEEATLVKRASKSDLQPQMADWLFDTERQAGDTTVIDFNGVPSVLYFVERSKDEVEPYTTRHILIKDVDETSEETTEDTEQVVDSKTKANQILEEYLAGEQTAEAFAELAKKYSDDPGSAANGGLYAGIIPGNFVKEYEEWALDPARKAGDVGMVRVENDNYSGYHIIYFEEIGEPNWMATAKAKMASERFEEEMEPIREGYSFEPVDAGMKYILPYDKAELKKIRESREQDLESSQVESEATTTAGDE